MHRPGPLHTGGSLIGAMFYLTCWGLRAEDRPLKSLTQVSIAEDGSDGKFGRLEWNRQRGRAHPDRQRHSRIAINRLQEIKSVAFDLFVSRCLIAECKNCAAS
jgi:hypothetical protein